MPPPPSTSSTNALSSSSEYYSYPPSLTLALSTSSTFPTRCLLCSPKPCLTALLTNSFQSLDELFFNTAPKVRKSKNFIMRRLTIRIHLDVENNVLHVTDYGVGMTRADLINVLGIGRAPVAVVAEKKSSRKGKEREKKRENERKSDDTESESETESDNEDNSGSSNGAMSSTNDKIVDCSQETLGSFYSAICGLSRAFEVATKAKYDDYYTFRSGLDDKETVVDSSDSSSSSSGNSDESKTQSLSRSSHSHKSFKITRPYPEGTVPSKKTGLVNIYDVTGDSGTRVSLHLSGFHFTVDELKGEIGRVFGESGYSCVFSDSVNGTGDGGEEKEEEYVDCEEELDMETGDNDDENDLDVDMEESSSPISSSSNNSNANSKQTVSSRAAYIPLRLTLPERKILRLIEASMTCSTYTSTIDGVLYSNPTKRAHKILQNINGIMHGLVYSLDHELGTELSNDREFGKFQGHYKSCFEIARRHKIMNPEKMRNEYGKLIYILQDSVIEEIKNNLDISLVKGIETVHGFLAKRRGLGLLDDQHIEVATAEVLPSNSKSRQQIQTEIKRKESAVAHIKRKYASSDLSEDEIHVCLYSIGDNNSYINSHCLPVTAMIGYLKQYFSPTSIEENYSLAIISGTDGARLSHSHNRQYNFVMQSLMLWRDILTDLYRLWALAEDDLLSPTISYTLKDTGQGLNRVQQSPKTYKAMQGILKNLQGQTKSWIGSSVIHLGDHNVPNALTFIDKYTQVPRILGPIINCLDGIERMTSENTDLMRFIEDQYGGLEHLRKEILYDFFTSAFDGSGAENFYDAGSCIDGRLTSAWNWCQGLSEKSYYPVFKLTGFVGFDGGDFK